MTKDIGFWVVDPRTRLVMGDAFVADLFDVASADLQRGMPLDVVLHASGDDSERLLRAIEAADRDQAGYELALSGRLRPAGRGSRVVAKGRPVGRPARIFGMFEAEPEAEPPGSLLDLVVDGALTARAAASLFGDAQLLELLDDVLRRVVSISEKPVHH